MYTTAIENLAIGSEFAFSSGRFGILATRTDTRVWKLAILDSDMQATDNVATVYSSNSREDDTVRVLRARAEFDNDEFYTSPMEHVSPRNAIRDAVTILING